MRQIELSYFLAFVVSDMNPNPVFTFGKNTYRFVGYNTIEFGDEQKIIMTVMDCKTMKFKAIECDKKAYKTPVIIY
jgi:hypothetical protein